MKNTKLSNLIGAHILTAEGKLREMYGTDGGMLLVRSFNREILERIPALRIKVLDREAK